MGKSANWYRRDGGRVHTLLTTEDYTFNPSADSGSVFIVPTGYLGTLTLSGLGLGQRVKVINLNDTLAVGRIVLPSLYNGSTNYYAATPAVYGWQGGVYDIQNLYGTFTCTNTPPIFTPEAMLGDGSEGDPFQIAYWYQLEDIADDLDAYYVLTDDIDMSNVASWTPIGTAIAPFTGQLDGDGYTISNLTSTSASGSALFDVLSSATVKDLIIDNAHITATNGNCSVFANTISSSTITNVSVTNSEITSTVNGYGFAATINTNDDGVTPSVLTHCSFEGAINTAGNSAMGFAGQILDSTIANSYVDATINGAGAGYHGGFAQNCESSTITDCYAVGEINGTDGLIGFVQVATDSAILFTGTVLTNCYSAMELKATAAEPTLYGFVESISAQWAEEGSAVSCYFDSTLAGTTDTAAGTAKSTAQMKQKATYLTEPAWDFTAGTGDWEIVEGVSYPSLQPS
jgi:hypothetical protein